MPFKLDVESCQVDVSLDRRQMHIAWRRRTSYLLNLSQEAISNSEVSDVKKYLCGPRQLRLMWLGRGVSASVDFFAGGSRLLPS